jgi:hypothetical protein
MKDVIKKSLNKSYSYNEYRELVSSLIKENKSTSQNGIIDLVEYSKLNDSRMKRLNKTTKLNSDTVNAFKNLSTPQTWIILSEGWCGDAAQNIPVINKIAELNSNINLRIILRDENLEFMNNFLTNGAQAIPKLIALDDNLDVITTWGPRPTLATKMVADYKAKHGKIDAELKKDLQLWYNKNKGENLSNDFIEIIV